jgi:hypothetical protein
MLDVGRCWPVCRLPLGSGGKGTTRLERVGAAAGPRA